MSLLTSWLRSAPPDAALELAADAVSAATLSGRGTTSVVQSFASQALPSGALTPTLVGHNVGSESAVVTAIQSVVAQLGSKPRRVALVIPDLAARVSLVRFEHEPTDRGDLDQLIRFTLKKSAPFPLEDACIAYAPGIVPPEGGREFLVVLAQRNTIREYESLCEKAGLYAGLVELSSFSVVNGFLPPGRVPTGDWLIVHMQSDYTSILIMRGSDVIFFRNRPDGDGDAFADLVHQTTMYYQDRLEGQGFSRVLVGGTGRTGTDVEIARRGLEDRLGVTVEPVDAARLAQIPERLGSASEHRGRIAPLVGMLLRTREDEAA